MRYLILISLFATSCAESYTLKTRTQTLRKLSPENVIELSYLLDSADTEVNHSFILYSKKKFIGRHYLMHMVDSIPGYYKATDYENFEYIGTNLWFLRKIVNWEDERAIGFI